MAHPLSGGSGGATCARAKSARTRRAGPPCVKCAASWYQGETQQVREAGLMVLDDLSRMQRWTAAAARPVGPLPHLPDSRPSCRADW